nr:RluA family pseudouridine synthase [Neobacillus sp. Marseille-Q6967]
MLRTMRKGNWLEIMTPENWEGQNLENLFRTIWQAPRKLTHLFRMEKKVLVNGIPANWTAPLHVNDKILIHIFSEERSLLPVYNQEIQVLYEDDHVIVVNKPPFMSTHPNDPKTDKSTLLNAILFYLQTKGETSNIQQVHRLDKDTSGAILFAKHSLAGSILDRKLEEREIKRTYIAMVHGHLKKKKGTIDKPIGRDRHHATRRRVSESGQAAVTHYQVIMEDKNLSYVKCWLETGRTHQIRVHLSSEGHPLAGDILYGGKPVVKRQALHAAKLEFLHPFTEERIICHAPFIDEPSIFKNINVFSI